MNILMVNKFLYPNGGSETYIFELGKQLERMGHSVQYFGMEHEGRVVGNRAGSYTANMDFHTGKLGKLLYPFRIIYSGEARRKLRKVLDDFSPDVVHLNNFNFQLTPSIIYEVRKYERQSGKKLRLVYTAHDYQLVCPNHMLRIPASNQNCEACLSGHFGNCTKNRCIHNSLVKSMLGSLEGWLYRSLKTYRQLDCLICPSAFMKQKLDSNPIFREKTVMLHNFIPEMKQQTVEKQRYVLYFGRYSREKGVSTLLKVCRRLPDIPFVFAGGGPLEEQVNGVKNIENKGFLRGEELHRLIAGAVMSIYPSEWYENCPFSVMESVFLGTPVVGADIGGIPELIRDGETGILFESKNEQALQRAVERIWRDEKLQNRLAQRCREEKFDSAEAYCEKLVRIYQGTNG